MHVDRGLAGAIVCGATVLAGMVGGATVAAAPSETAVLELQPPADDRFATTYPAVGDLEDGSVLRLQLSGFAPGTTGVIHQCVYSAGEIGDCANPFPVNIDDDGRAQAQYQVSSRFADGASSCVGHVRPCVVVVDDPDGNRAVATTVFGGALPPPAEITVRHAGPGIRRDGDHVGRRPDAIAHQWHIGRASRDARAGSGVRSDHGGQRRSGVDWLCHLGAAASARRGVLVDGRKLFPSGWTPEARRS